ncbi:MAG TPA: hypothetical protein VMR99_02255 [Candidatus Paceibacterota bacterium]|nr:hypothetical protein [Candidatus Paceibacterota bacterium]
MATATSTSQTLQQLQAQATQGVQAAGQNFMTTYFSHLGMLEFFGIVIALICLAAIVYFVIETGWFSLRVERFRHIILQSDISKKRIQESWQRIEEYLYRGGESDLKVAIIEADKLLNDALREAGVMGTQLGDRLKQATAEQIPNLNEIWQAHKLRNQIAHEPGFKLKRDPAERAIGIYKTALKNLGVFEGQPEK